MSAAPVLYFHQTLTFPPPMLAAKPAKLIFNKFIKGVLKYYQKNELAGVYVQETSKEGRIHFHVCFLFFCVDKLPYCPSRRHRDFRADIFKRWNAANDFKAVHPANVLKEHPFDLKSLEYFTKALIVADDSTTRAETNWWGLFNKQLITSRAATPTRQKKKEVFDAFFKRCLPDCSAFKPNGAFPQIPVLGEDEVVGVSNGSLSCHTAREGTARDLQSLPSSRECGSTGNNPTYFNHVCR